MRNGDNRKIAMWMRDRFPHPYLREHAEQWIGYVVQQTPPLNFAITLDGHLIGGIGLMPGSDINRISAEVGYWLGEAHWGQGIATAALRGITRHAFASFDFNRLFATAAAGNAGSIRVLQKAGYRHEGTLIGSAIKEGRILDQVLYAMTRREAAG